MAITYEWSFPALDVKYSDGDLKNVVTTVHWTLTATDGEHTASVYGSVGVPEPTPEEFVSYEDLTKEEVQSWVESSLRSETEVPVTGDDGQDTGTEVIVKDGVEELKLSLAQQIETLKAPVTGTMTPPWQN